jgi:hypothetical protein
MRMASHAAWSGLPPDDPATQDDVSCPYSIWSAQGAYPHCAKGSAEPDWRVPDYG